MQTFPTSRPEDSENVLVALEVGRAMWGRGDRRDAMKWLRQAIDEAFEGGDDARGLDLSKQAADMASDPSLAPPPMPESGPIDLELPSRASDVPLSPLRAATGRFAALRAQTVPPPQPTFGGASARPVDDAPAAPPAPTPLARVPLGRMSTPLLTVAPAARASLGPPPPPRAPAAPRRRAWATATALRVALRQVDGEVRARALGEDDAPREGEVEATLLAPSADSELRALFAEALDRTALCAREG